MERNISVCLYGAPSSYNTYHVSTFWLFFDFTFIQVSLFVSATSLFNQVSCALHCGVVTLRWPEQGLVRLDLLKFIQNISTMDIFCKYWSTKRYTNHGAFGSELWNTGTTFRPDIWRHCIVKAIWEDFIEIDYITQVQFPVMLVSSLLPNIYVLMCTVRINEELGHKQYGELQIKRNVMSHTFSEWTKDFIESWY